MAKINITRRLAPQYWKVEISVVDPECSFSIKPEISYEKVFKATNPNAAIRAAANYCTKYMKYYPGVEFKYSTKVIEPYYYTNFITATKEDL